jgi:glycosyltransferase involved in cell wall biosynthesis
VNERACIRVAFVNHTAQLGGGEIALLELIRNLDRSKIQPIVVLFADGPLVPLLREMTEVHILPLSSGVLKANKDHLGVGSLLQGSSVIAGIAFLWRLHGLLQSIQPRIVHTNSLKADILGGIAGRLAGLTVIWHVRDRITPEYLPRLVVRAFQVFATLIPSFIIANSAATLSCLSLGDEPKEQGVMSMCRVVHDGVDPKKYKGTINSTENKPLTIGLVGRISPWKGQDIFIESIYLLHDKYPDVRFLIIGAPTFGELEFEKHVHGLIQQYGLNNVVRCTGFEPDIPKFLSSLDIVVHASTIPEPFGQVIIEGMAAGKPVIATNGGGVPEIIVDGVTGILVPMKDPRAMAEAISNLIMNAHLRTMMGIAARQHVENNFTIQQTAAAVQQCLSYC